MKSLCFIVAAGYGSCLTLTVGCSNFDKMLDIVVIDIIWCRVISQEVQLEPLIKDDSTHSSPREEWSAVATSRRTSLLSS